MALSAPFRKASLLVHITTSVGWTGAVAAFLVLAVTGIEATDPLTIRAVYLAMEPVTRFVIVPFAFASLATGLLLSLCTPWGLFRHYWIVFKLLINVISIVLLLVHTRVIRQVAAAAAFGPILPTALPGPRAQLVQASALALAALFAASFLSVYKPRGLTLFNQRNER